ncbi:Bro-N domain-containing protein [Patescibacteria group bacterium]|nr:Bro-N domain-containing protein [Patescibacteria group bacterium]MBU1015932.1 Bro-N domain-containing protein [Patescibacteria group bacterium]MBU1685101.1 Bro-N domain-containing protein [Patescibacteria group bacterium]MBU1938195.1 Bro-N domain-containing protein [Patescibacteria group bacterium]
MKKETSIILFNQKAVRRHWDAEKELWYFSVIDVIAVLTDSTTPKRYWSDLKIRLEAEGSEAYEKIVRLKMLAPDNKKRETDCFSTEDLLRLIQSIPSKKAEPFKVWLAQVGYERIEETENPELSFERMVRTYAKKGYSMAWINQRLKSIEVRKELTDEWRERGMKEGAEYAILTDEITKAWSGKTVKEYKAFKELKKEGLRDNMNTLELVLNMLAEASTTEISKERKPKGFKENKQVANDGGSVAGIARKEIEKKTGKRVISPKKSGHLLT